MPLIYKIIVLILLLTVVISLASALVALVKGDTSDRVVKSLTWRIGLSVFIFVLLIIGQATGVISPHGLY